MDPAFDLFLSHDHDDALLVDKLRAALSAHGLKVWQDSQQIRPGERWAHRLEVGLESSRAFALVATKRALKSRWVETEYLTALDLAHTPGRDFTLIALRFEDVRLPLLLQTFQAVDFRDVSCYEANVASLSQAVIAARSRDAAPAPPPDPRGDTAAARAEQDVRRELDYLKDALDREAQDVRHLQRMRGIAPIVGLLLALAAIAGGQVPLSAASGTLALAGASTVGLLGWGVTHPLLMAARARIGKLTLLRDGLADCQEHPRSTCPEFRVEFWRTVQGGAAAAAR